MASRGMVHVIGPNADGRYACANSTGDSRTVVTARIDACPRGRGSLALSLCRELDLVHVVDPFVTAPDPAQPVYWRLHGAGGPRSSYSQAQLQQLAEMLSSVAHPGPRYVMFNNMPRVGDAKRFAQLIAG